MWGSVFLPWVNTEVLFTNTACQSHTLTHPPSVSLPHTNTQTLAWFWSKRAKVRGERLWERGGPVAWNCHRPDKLACNLNKLTLSSGQYPREESTMPLHHSTLGLEQYHTRWNNIIAGPRLSQHGTGWTEATLFGEQHHTMPAMGNDPSCADHS